MQDAVPCQRGPRVGDERDAACESDLENRGTADHDTRGTLQGRTVRAPGGAMMLNWSDSGRKEDQRAGIIRAEGAAGRPGDLGTPSRGRDGGQAE